MPQTGEEQAIARTLATYRQAIRSHDPVTLRRLIMPDATIKGDYVPQASLRVAIFQRSGTTQLTGAPTPLVNFRQESPTRASVATYVEADFQAVSRTTYIEWDLLRRDGRWHIETIKQTVWRTQRTYPYSDP